MGVFARASLAEHVDAQEVIDVTAAGIAFYERAFDYDFPFRKYDQIFVPEYNLGAMENPGAITFVESYVFRSQVSDAVRERRDQIGRASCRERVQGPVAAADWEWA